MLRSREHCPNLKSVHLRGACEEGGDGVAALLTSCGEQFTFAYLHDMNEGQLTTIADACPNASFHLEKCRVDLTVSGFLKVGPKSKFITLLE